MDGEKGRVDGMMDRCIDGQLDSKMSPKIMLPFCHPRSICFLVSPAPCFILTHFNRESSRYPALKEIICWSHASLKILSVPNTATLSPTTSMRVSVSKGVPQHTNTQAIKFFCTTGAEHPDFPPCALSPQAN
jgi:hypothetical protein